MMEKDLFYKRRSSRLLWGFKGERSHFSERVREARDRWELSPQILVGWGATVGGSSWRVWLQQPGKAWNSSECVWGTWPG